MLQPAFFTDDFPTSQAPNGECFTACRSPPGHKYGNEPIQTNTINLNTKLLTENPTYFVAFSTKIIHQKITAKETNESIDKTYTTLSQSLQVNKCKFFLIKNN